jgi:hypothetical protein
VPATVRRPAPQDDPIATRVIWSTPSPEAMPGGDFSRREPVRVMALRRDEVPTVPRGTHIDAPEMPGGAVKTWKVDSFEREDTAQTRVFVVPVGDE